MNEWERMREKGREWESEKVEWQTNFTLRERDVHVSEFVSVCMGVSVCACVSKWEKIARWFFWLRTVSSEDIDRSSREIFRPKFFFSFASNESLLTLKRQKRFQKWLASTSTATTPTKATAAAPVTTLMARATSTATATSKAQLTTTETTKTLHCR